MVVEAELGTEKFADCLRADDRWSSIACDIAEAWLRWFLRATSSANGTDRTVGEEIVGPHLLLISPVPKLLRYGELSKVFGTDEEKYREWER